MVDAERAGARLDRLEHLVERLEHARGEGEDKFLADDVLRMATERQLQLAIQVCIDLGAQLVAELSVQPPTDYSGIFTALADAGHLDRDLAARLADAAKQRNVLVHMYLEIDDRKVFASLDNLDDLRAFAAWVQKLMDEEVAR